MSYYSELDREREDELYVEQCLKEVFGEDWIDDDPYNEAFGGQLDAYWNID
ncbi:MAG: hypothetical protein IJ151_07165 [Bacteroidales bacterium]|nr:hypothetical protein [Bacteroidales bacterium]